MTCDRGIDAGAYVLHALDDVELDDYAQHLAGCADCRREVAQLQTVVDTLPMAAPQTEPPPALKDRIMRTVLAEAELLQAAGPEADRVPSPAPKRRRGLRLGGLTALRPALAGGLAAVLVALGVAGGALVRGGEDEPATSVVTGTTTMPGAKVALALTQARGELRVRALPPAKGDRVYQVWLQTGDEAPRPSRTLFDVRRDGRADVQIAESLEGVDRVLVTAEPHGGSSTPSGAPVLVAETSA